MAGPCHPVDCLSSSKIPIEAAGFEPASLVRRLASGFLAQWGVEPHAGGQPPGLSLRRTLLSRVKLLREVITWQKAVATAHSPRLRNPQPLNSPHKYYYITFWTFCQVLEIKSQFLGLFSMNAATSFSEYGRKLLNSTLTFNIFPVALDASSAVP